MDASFRAVACGALALALLMLLSMFADLLRRGLPAFTQSYIALEIHLAADTIGVFDATDPQQLAVGSYQSALAKALQARFPAVTEPKQKRELKKLLSLGASSTLQYTLAANPELLNSRSRWWLLADQAVDSLVKSNWRETSTGLSEFQLGIVKQLYEQGELRRRLNWQFLLMGDSTEPEQAGIGAALLGSVMTLLLTFLFAFPFALATSIYLEEYAGNNRFNRFIQLNINNLVAAPPIIYGLLGLAIFINFFELSRSVPLVAALVLTLMTIPAMIVGNRVALQRVRKSVREAAFAMGASKMQTILHYILPLAFPRIIAGALVALGRALGEGASLLLIGMAAFIVDKPSGINDPATVLPVQIYLWAQSPNNAFVERAAAAILVLLALLLAVNSLAVYFRRWGR